ncbi:unnamed protein product [Lupinus luteus]|uniref:Pectin acetylesterase n=1 Tax=Lupinus luteus TaxID=3873 RepID=A0AAV1X4R9_LUPLU
MNKLAPFNGILSNDPSLNPDFYNWNRVKLRYCDGASFTGDAVFTNGTKTLYFKGQKIWEAIINDLIPKGLGKASKALLSGCSAGGLAAFHQCDNLAKRLPNADVKCMSDAGFFLDVEDISSKYTMRNIFKGVVELHEAKKNLNTKCTSALQSPDLCFFPQYALKYISPPYFILNTAYDVYQFRHALVPPSSDNHRKWNHCKQDPALCKPDEINILQGFRNYMLDALKPINLNSEKGGMFINSCFAHCQSESQDTWSGPDSPRVNNKSIAEAVGDWYFDRKKSKEIDCEYPYDKTCHNLIPQPPGGGWCNDLASCLERAKTRRGSTPLKNKLEPFNGILSNDPSLNPDFHNWNRVKLRYCDGASFTGDAVFTNGTKTLYFKGQKIWEAIIDDLIPKGLGKASKALLSGCSAGGLATFHHCDNLAKQLPNAHVKCMSDAGFFLDVEDISSKYTMRSFFKGVVELQGVEKNLNTKCTSALQSPDLCFFPQYALKFISPPYFILNTAYDVYQFHNALVPPSSDKQGKWNRCRNDPAACTPEEIHILQGFRSKMLDALKPINLNSEKGGMFINSCFAHCQSESQDWLGRDSPRVNNKRIAEAVGDWYFDRKKSKEIDCEYPCDKTCHNLIPQPPVRVQRSRVL